MADVSGSKKDLSPLARSLKYLEGRFGKGMVMTLDGIVEKRDCISSGHPFVDYVLGGGFFFGQHIEVFGFESSGKSTLSYQAAINCQKMKFNTGRVLIVDAEHSWSKSYYKALGGLTDGDHLLVCQPDTGEDGLEVMREFIDNELVDLIIVDSVSALLPQAEEAVFLSTSGNEVESGTGKQKGQMGMTKVGSQSALMSQGLKQLSQRISKKRVCVIWINQIRTKINTSGGPSSETTSGGNALKFYAAVRLELRKIGAIQGEVFDPFENKVKKANIAIKTIVRGAKNKMAPPFREAPVTIRFGAGMDVADGILMFAVNQGLLAASKAGHYRTKDIGATRNARGLDDFRSLMKAEPAVWDALVAKCDFEKAMEGTPIAPEVITANDVPEGFNPAAVGKVAEGDLDAMLTAPNITEQPCGSCGSPTGHFPKCPEDTSPPGFPEGI